MTGVLFLHGYANSVWLMFVLIKPACCLLKFPDPMGRFCHFDKNPIKMTVFYWFESLINEVIGLNFSLKHGI